MRTASVSTGCIGETRSQAPTIYMARTQDEIFVAPQPSPTYAGGGTRTRKPSQAGDFKSPVFTDFTTPADGEKLLQISAARLNSSV